MRLLPIILLLSIAGHAQPGGYTAGTQVCWQFNSRDHGYFRAVGWDANVDHILVFFPGLGETSCANYDGMQPGLFLRDGGGGSNWDGITNLPAEFGSGSRKWMVFIMTNQGTQPLVYRDDVNHFLENSGITLDLEEMRDEGRLHLAGGSAGPGNAQSYLGASGNTYATYFSTGIWMTTTLTTASVNIPAKNFCWYAEDDNPLGSTPPSATVNFFNQCPGIEDVDKFLDSTDAGHNNTTWGDCMGISGTTYETNRWIWMIVQGEGLIVPPSYPPPVLVGLSTQRVYDLVQANKPTYRLVDGDTVAHVYPDCFEGYIINEFKTQGIWIDLDTFVTHPKVEVYHDGNGGGTFSVQFYYGYEDTTRHSSLFSTTLPSTAWKGVDTTNSRAYTDSIRFIKVIINDCVHHVTEIRVYGNKCGKAPTIFDTYASPPSDPGKRLMYYGKVFTDIEMDDAGWGQRVQNSMDYIDTGATSDGKNIVFNRFGNSTDATLIPSQAMDLDIMMYFANLREAFKYDPLDAQSKDMPIAADSVDETSWIPVYNTHYGIAAKFGNNPSANVTGYTFLNTNPGIGQNYIKELEIGNEDMQHWNGSRRFHDPHVQLLKIKAGYEGVKAADPSMPVISGALTGLRFDRLRAMYFTNLLRFQSRSYPCDAIALNEYSTTAGGQAQGGSYQGTTPEQFNLKAKLDSLREIRDSLFPGRGLYITEFGYDAANYTEDGEVLDTVAHESNYNVPDVSGQTRDQTKSYWTMRWYEIGAAARMDRMVQYSQRDIAGSDFATTGYSYTINLPFAGNTLPSYLHQFMSGGVLSGGGFTSLPKELYWHMTCRRYRLQNYNAWPSVIAEGDSTGVWALRYTHTSDADSLIYSVWKGTHSNSTTSNYVLNIPNVATATLVTPVIGDKDGTTSALSIVGSNVTVPTVNEGVQYILVTLDAEANQSPTAAAGTDQSITLPTSQVTVNGSSSTDPDGTIDTYLWTKISGPATFSITNANIASTTITGLVAGTYVFRLTVTDNDGAQNTDDIQVTVGAAPVLNRRGWFRGSLRNKYINQ